MNSDQDCLFPWRQPWTNFKSSMAIIIALKTIYQARKKGDVPKRDTLEKGCPFSGRPQFLEFYLNNVFLIINEAKTIETMDISLIKIFKLGPEVSLNGSPTVSPTTVAL